MKLKNYVILFISVISLFFITGCLDFAQHKSNYEQTPLKTSYDGGEIITITMQGISPEDVSISIENNALCIKGESEKKSEIDEKNYYRKEIREGSFSRSVEIPCAVDRNKAKASYKDGILEIVLPKTQEERKKELKISIQ